MINWLFMTLSHLSNPEFFNKVMITLNLIENPKKDCSYKFILSIKLHENICRNIEYIIRIQSIINQPDQICKYFWFEIQN